MTDTQKYFPEGIAKGEAFINRTEERNYLINRIKSTKHTVLMAPRRYGKTSLVIKVADEMETPYSAIDLLAAYSAEYVRDQIANKVSLLAFKLLPRINKAKEKLLAIFQQMKPEITIGAFGQKLSLTLSNQPLNDITELLLNLDKTAKQLNKKAVIFLDEFQQISQLEEHHAIEASIRHAVERSEHISYVFSGSNRRLLKQIFGDSGRPLYKLCQTLAIDRIDKNIYFTQLEFLADKRWKTTLKDGVIEKIFQHTELHPYYMNVLCQILWEQNTSPDINSVDRAWSNYVTNQRHMISHDINELTPNQRKILTSLARKPAKEIQSSDFTAPLKISPSSSKQSATALLRNDLIYKHSDGYFHVLDPAMRYYLNHVIWDNF